MINFSLAIRSAGWGLLLAPFFFLYLLFFRWRIRQMRVRWAQSVSGGRKLFRCRMASYVSLILFLASILWCVGVPVEMAFDWSPNDVSEIDILEFSSPDPQTIPLRTIRITNQPTLFRLLSDLKLLQIYGSHAHESAVGRSYVLRLRRRSDGLWSGYRVKIFPDMEAAGGGLRMKDVDEVTLDIASGRLTFGDYQAQDLGRFVDRLVGKK